MTDLEPLHILSELLRLLRTSGTPIFGAKTRETISTPLPSGAFAVTMTLLSLGSCKILSNTGSSLSTCVLEGSSTFDTDVQKNQEKINFGTFWMRNINSTELKIQENLIQI
jgi:hypothetical protein